MWHILVALMIMLGTQSAVGKVVSAPSREPRLGEAKDPKSAAPPPSAAPTVHLHTIDVYLGQHASVLAAGISLIDRT